MFRTERKRETVFALKERHHVLVPIQLCELCLARRRGPGLKLKKGPGRLNSGQEVWFNDGYHTNPCLTVKKAPVRGPCDFAKNSQILKFPLPLLFSRRNRPRLFSAPR